MMHYCAYFFSIHVERTAFHISRKSFTNFVAAVTDAVKRWTNYSTCASLVNAEAVTSLTGPWPVY